MEEYRVCVSFADGSITATVQAETPNAAIELALQELAVTTETIHQVVGTQIVLQGELAA